VTGGEVKCIYDGQNEVVGQTFHVPARSIISACSIHLPILVTMMLSMIVVAGALMVCRSKWEPMSNSKAMEVVSSHAS
jgi:hypothetical protein